MLFVGIDGGQSSTVAVVVDATGAILGRGTAGPSDHVGEPSRSRRAAEACEGALAAALADAGLPSHSDLEAVVIGLSGYEGRWHGIEPVFRSPILRVVHDAPIALAGATAVRPAAVVIAGTGSVGYGETAAGDPVLVGGYGYLFGDEGSSFAIARAALTGAMRAADRGVRSDLAAAAAAFFDVPDLRALVRGVALGEISRPRIATFARVVHDAARLGDADADAIIDDASEALVGLASALLERLDATEAHPVPVAFVGGALENGELRYRTQHRLLDRAPQGVVIPPRNEPAVGAALLAFDAARVPRPPQAER